jgi:hypothetical protein
MVSICAYRGSRLVNWQFKKESARRFWTAAQPRQAIS